MLTKSHPSSPRPYHQLIFIFLMIVLAIQPLSVMAQDYELVVRVGNVLAPAGTQGIPIPVYMEN